LRNDSEATGMRIRNKKKEEKALHLHSYRGETKGDPIALDSNLVHTEGVAKLRGEREDWARKGIRGREERDLMASVAEVGEGNIYKGEKGNLLR